MNNNNNLYFETVKCLICNEKLFDIQSKHSVYNDNVFIVKCKCDFVYLNPRPTIDSISMFYNENYMPHNSRNYNFILKKIQKITFKWKSYNINKFIPKSESMLDIGSGDGAFAHYMIQKGWNVRTYDKFSSKSNKDTNYSNQKYKLITMWHSLEHLHNIDLIINEVYNLLSDGSYLFIAVPNYDSIDRRIFKDKWVALDVPRHLHHFTSFTLERYLLKNNIKIVKKKIMLQDTIFNIVQSTPSNLILKVVLFPFILLISLVYIFINKENSSSILYICQKK